MSGMLTGRLSLKEYRNLFSNFSTSGIYILLLFLSQEINLNVGKLGKRRLPKGYYTYTGSALGKKSLNLKQRITSHLRNKDRKFWHIDYLLANENSSVETIIVAETNEKLECEINQYLKKMMDARIPVEGFGASDCKKNCGSHLLYFPKLGKTDLLIKIIVKHLPALAGILSVSVVH